MSSSCCQPGKQGWTGAFQERFSLRKCAERVIEAIFELVCDLFEFFIFYFFFRNGGQELLLTLPVQVCDLSRGAGSSCPPFLAVLGMLWQMFLPCLGPRGVWVPNLAWPKEFQGGNSSRGEFSPFGKALPFSPIISLSSGIFVLLSSSNSTRPPQTPAPPFLPPSLTPLFWVLKSDFMNPPVPSVPVCVSAQITINAIPLIAAPKGAHFHTFPLSAPGAVWGDLGGFCFVCFAFLPPGQCRCLVERFPR